MQSKPLAVMAAAVTLFAGGCATNQPLPLLFGQAQTVGVAIAATAPEQGGELSIGYRDKNIAVVPIQALANTPEGHKDALSVLGRFDVEAGGTQPLNASIGKFFATGVAAQSLAVGFACEMSNGKACGGVQQPDISTNQPGSDTQ